MTHTLDRLRVLPYVSYDGPGPPASSAAARCAAGLIARAGELTPAPEALRIAPTSCGGVVVGWQNGARHVQLTVDSGGLVAFMTCAVGQDECSKYATPETLADAWEWLRGPGAWF